MTLPDGRGTRLAGVQADRYLEFDLASGLAGRAWAVTLTREDSPLSAANLPRTRSSRAQEAARCARSVSLSP